MNTIKESAFSLPWISTIIDISFKELFPNNIFKYSEETFKKFDNKLSEEILFDFIVSNSKQYKANNYTVFSYIIQDKYKDQMLEIEFHYNKKSGRILSLDTFFSFSSNKSDRINTIKTEYTFELKYISLLNLSIDLEGLSISNNQPFMKFPTARQSFIFEINNTTEILKESSQKIIQEFKDKKVVNQELLDFINVVDEDNPLVNSMNFLMKNDDLNKFLSTLYKIPQEISKHSKNKYKIT